MNRAVLFAVLAIGLGLVVVPLAISMPGKAADGEQMMKDFDPIMQRLPPFNLMAWFFVIPGLALVALATFGLYSDHRARASESVTPRHATPTPA